MLKHISSLTCKLKISCSELDSFFNFFLDSALGGSRDSLHGDSTMKGGKKQLKKKKFNIKGEQISSSELN